MKTARITRPLADVMAVLRAREAAGAMRIVPETK
jgi:hypothetical protein